MTDPKDPIFATLVSFGTAIGGLMEDVFGTHALANIMVEVAERARQDAKWGEQNHPITSDGENPYDIGTAQALRRECQRAANDGTVTYTDILLEEVAEAIEASQGDDAAAARAELVQVAAVVVAMIERIDRKGTVR